MDDAAYDEPNMYETPLNDDERYKNLWSTQGNNPSYGIKTSKCTNQQDGDKENSSKHKLKYLLVLIVITVILLVLVLTSIALSVATYTLSSSEQSKVIAESDKTNNKMVSLLAQLSTAQSNISQLNAKLKAIISENKILQSQTQCGPGLWYRLIYMNMSDPSQQCPPAWREYSNNGMRACGRPNSNTGSCSAIVTLTHIQYSRICGRVIGFQYGTPDAFRRFGLRYINFDGINITYGVQRNHIWSYVAGVLTDFINAGSKCPCSEGRTNPPQFHHKNYYCESGNIDAYYTINKLNTDDPLWDGQQCEGTCCNGINSPPWFSVQLPTPTTDGVEASICCDQGTNDEDVPVQLIEIYVQ